MKRTDIIKRLINEGFSDKFLSKLTDKQLKEVSQRVLSEEVLNIPKDDQASIEKAKSDNKQFVTYEEESGEVEVVKNTKKSTKNSKKEMKEWVEGIVKKNYHPDVTTKKEIYEMIGSLSNSADSLVDAKNMFDVDEQSPSPSKPDTDAPVREKPTTRPGKPKRENPFEPKHTPKPKAKLPKELSFNTLGFDFKQAAE
jgi:hypothetical protein